MKVKVSLGFARISDADLDNFAQGVNGAMTGNVTYPSPPISMATLETAREDFMTKFTAAQTGGPPHTAAKKESRQRLVGMLRVLAAYVQMSCQDDLALLLRSGFEVQATKGASVPLDRPEGLSVKNGGTGQLVVRVNPVKNKNMYEGRAKLEDSDWMPSVFASDSMHITFTGLTPGKIYTIQVRALGGATGQSDWSDPISHMSM